MLAQLPPPQTIVYSDNRLRQNSTFVRIDGLNLQRQSEDIKNRVKLNDDFLLIMKDYPANNSLKEKVAAELV